MANTVQTDRLSELAAQLDAIKAEMASLAVQQPTEPAADSSGPAMTDRQYRKEAKKRGIKVSSTGLVSQETKRAVDAAITAGKVKPKTTAIKPTAKVAAGTRWGEFKISSGGGRLSNEDAGKMLPGNPYFSDAKRITSGGWLLISNMGAKQNPNPANLMPKHRAQAFRMRSIDRYIKQGGGQSLLLAACEIVQVLNAAGISVDDVNAQAVSLGL